MCVGSPVVRDGCGAVPSFGRDDRHHKNPRDGKQADVSIEGRRAEKKTRTPRTGVAKFRTFVILK